MSYTMAQLREANEIFFSPEAQRSYGDTHYWINNQLLVISGTVELSDGKERKTTVWYYITPGTLELEHVESEMEGINSTLNPTVYLMQGEEVVRYAIDLESGTIGRQLPLHDDVCP
jgi:hypothetical protein